MQFFGLLAFTIIFAFFFIKLFFPVKSTAGLGKLTARASVKERQRFGSRAGNTFHAVSIHPSKDGCLAAEAISGERFLSREAPSLPLESCTATSCNCRYYHHSDRRFWTRGRREFHSDEDDFVGFFEDLDRRMAETDRRRSDWAVS
jgi:hypothetical protein